MILATFLTLITLFSLFLIIGYLKGGFAYEAIAYTMLFLAGTGVLLSGGLQIPTGTTTKTTYNHTASTVSQTTSTQYTDYSEFWFGFLLSIIAIAGFGFGLFEIEGMKLSDVMNYDDTYNNKITEDDGL